MEPSHFESLYPEDTRFSEIKKILEFIKEGNSCQIIGVPGVGRSNLLGLLAYNKKVKEKHLGENQKWFHFVLLNFSEIKNKTILEVTKFIFLGLLDSLRERRMDNEYEKINSFFKESLKANDELVLFDGLKKAIDFLSIEKEFTVVFLLDRFEEHIPSLSPDFFSNLRILRNRAKYRFSVVISSSRPIEDILEPTFFSDFYEFTAGKLIYLTLYDRAGMNFRIAYLEKITGKKIKNNIIEDVISLTGGHGNLTRHSLEAVLSVNQKINGEIKEFLLKQMPVRSALFAIWNALNPDEQTKISLLNFGSIDVEFLRKLGLVKDNSLQIPLLRDYLKDSARIRSEETGKIVFDKNSNQIKKGQVVLSDKLTSSEFKLLKFFILNGNKVVERNEVVSAVWGEMQSTAGVTEQAIDQLISRLRKKIEDNPNSPVYIQTVKGRGFKFTP